MVKPHTHKIIRTTCDLRGHYVTREVRFAASKGAATRKLNEWIAFKSPWNDRTYKFKIEEIA